MNRKQRRSAGTTPPSPGPGIQQVFAEAVEHHRAGRLNEAERRYRWILQADPRHADALHLLGVVAHQSGHHAAAIDLIGRAIALNDKATGFHDSLGNALVALRRLDEAVAAYRRSLALQPGNARTYYNLGVALQEQGNAAEAVDAYRRALALEPADADTHGNLGNALKQQGQLEAAAAAYRQALLRRPDYAPAHYNLGILCQERGDLDAAVAYYHEAIGHQPAYALAHYNLGIVLLAQGRLDEAAASFRAALALTPDHAEAHNNLGIVLQEQGALEAAADSYRQALTLKPDFAEAHNNLGSALQEQGRLDEAVAAYATALVHKPDYAEAAMGIAFTQLYQPGVRLADILAQAQRLNDLLGHRQPKAHTPPAQADRLPKIGFVSADFRSHAVGALALPAIEGLAGAGFTLACYSNSPKSDALTERFIAAATLWRRVAGMSDDALEQLIRADAIDILIDLSGYSAGNRLAVFARKPAPIQVTWIGYPATTGLAAMDYILADRHQLPPQFEAFYTEAAIRLPDSYIAFVPPGDAPPVNELPVLSGHGITFGSFNALKKITPEVVGVWSRILARLPDSRLLLKAPALDCAATRQRYLTQFTAQGIAPERLTLVGRTSRAEHLAQMQAVDIALDSFPYAGGQTTLEALWMGLPVIALPGESFGSRHSLGYLSNIALDEFAADRADRYVELAVGLAEDSIRLAQVRSGLRTRMLASPLCDVDRFTSHLSTTFTSIWQRWCNGEPAAPFDVN